MDNNNINKMVTDAMSSMDHAHKASPAPYLLTRINARMQNVGSKTGLAEKVLLFVTRPAVAFPALALVVVLNVWLFTQSFSEKNTLAKEYKQVTDDYSLSSATSLFDIENLP